MPEINVFNNLDIITVYEIKILQILNLYKLYYKIFLYKNYVSTENFNKLIFIIYEIK